MTFRQRRLDGSEFIVESEPPVVPYRTDYEGYETWRRQYRESGQKREETVRIHRLAAVAWFGLEAVADGEVVIHHRNAIPWDNRESNLEPMGLYDHSVLHNPGEGNSR